MLSVMAAMLVVVALVLMVGGSALAQDGVTIRFASWDTGDAGERTQNILEDFTAETGVDVVWEQMENAADPAILVQMAAGTAPDVIQTGELVLRRFATAEGGFMDLTPMMDADPDFGPEMFFDTVWSVGEIDGASYAVNKDFATTAYYVNVGMFEEAGLDIPKRAGPMMT
jgi:ABC-type glycerol-3-phosphate transport system substrate-binding protein